MSLSKRDEGKKVNSDINVTPMVDVMLVLLIIFMVVTPMLNNKVNVDLPVVTAATILDNAVYFRADTRANYGNVMDAIDGLRTGGVSQLNLLTDSVNETH